MTAARYGHAAQKARRQTGTKAEEIVALRLVSLGCVQVQRIETGWRIHRAQKADGKGGMRSVIVGASPIRNVAGDLRAIVPVSGRSVLCECKKRPDALGWHDFEDHQRASLTAHHQAGGISLIAWVASAGISVMRWPVVGFMPGHPLKWPTACLLNLESIPH